MLLTSGVQDLGLLCGKLDMQAMCRRVLCFHFSNGSEWFGSLSAFLLIRIW